MAGISHLMNSYRPHDSRLPGDADTSRPHDLFRHAGFLHRLARGLVRDDFTADDVMQETWVATLRDRPRDPERARGWLARITRSFAARQHRAAARRSRHEQRARTRRVEPSAADTAARLELERLVVAAVTALDEPCRTTIVKRFFDGLPPSTIAREMNVPVRTVESRLRRGLERLRDRLDKQRNDWRAGLVALAGLRMPRAGTTVAAALTTIAVPLAAAAVVVVSWITLGSNDNAPTRTTGHAARGPVVLARGAPGPRPPLPLPQDALTQRVRLLRYHLRHGATWRRRRSALELAALGEKARAAIPDLLSYLSHEQGWWDEARGEIEQALGRMAPVSLPAMTALLQHTDGEIRASGLRALGHGGAASRPAIPAVVARLRAEIEWYAGEAGRALARMGEPGIAALLREASTLRHVRGRRLGHPTLQFIPPNPFERAFTGLGSELAAPLARLLEADDTFARANAAAALHGLGANAAPALPAILRAIRNRKFGDRTRLLRLLGVLGTHGRGAASILVAELRGFTARERVHALLALPRLPDAHAVAHHLAAWLHEPGRSERMRERGAGGLIALGAGGPHERDLLVETVAGGSLSWAPARDILRGHGTRIEGLVPMLRDRLIAALIAERTARDRSRSGRLLSVLRVLGQAGKRALAIVHERTRPAEHRRIVAESCDDTRALLPRVFNPVRRELLMDEGYARSWSGLARGLAPADGVVRSLAARAQQADPIAEHALGALVALRAKQAIPLLLRRLADEDRRTYAARALGRMGLLAKPALGTLRKLVETEHDAAVVAAAGALARITGDDSALRMVIERDWRGTHDAAKRELATLSRQVRARPR